MYHTLVSGEGLKTLYILFNPLTQVRQKRKRTYIWEPHGPFLEGKKIKKDEYVSSWRHCVSQVQS